MRPISISWSDQRSEVNALVPPAASSGPALHASHHSLRTIIRNETEKIYVDSSHFAKVYIFSAMAGNVGWDCMHGGSADAPLAGYARRA